MKAKNVFISISVIVVSFLLFIYACMIFTPKDKYSDEGANYYRGKGFLSEPDNSLDIIAFGHSSVYSGFYPDKLFSEYGYTSYASGIPMQNIISINHLLKKSIRKQKPKIAILEVDCLYYYINDVIDNTSWLNSAFKYHYRWKNLKLKDFLTVPDLSKIPDKSKGFDYTKNVVPVTNYKTYMGNQNDKPQPISEKNIKHINKFIKICRKNNIKVMFFVTTNTGSWSYARHNYIKAFSAENNIDFLDYNINPEETIKLDFSKDFRDNGAHLNVYGAEKTTVAIGKSIKEKYGNLLYDKRSNSNFNFWKHSPEHNVGKVNNNV